MMKYKAFTDCVDFVGSACKPFIGTKKYISTGAVDTDHIVASDVELVDYEGKPSRANLEVSAGDILFAKMQGTKKTLSIDETLSNNIYSTGFCGVRAKDGILTSRCLYHLLTSRAFLDQKDKNCSGATQKAITNAGLSKIHIRIPDYSEQVELVDKLDSLTTIISQRKMEIQFLDDLIKARFIEMFGDPKTNPYKWAQVAVKDVCSSIVRGPFGSALKKDFFVGKSKDSYKVYEQKNAIRKSATIGSYYITAEKYAELRRFKCGPGDILMSCSGTMGEFFQLPTNSEKGIINQALCKFTLNKKILPARCKMKLQYPTG